MRVSYNIKQNGNTTQVIKTFPIEKSATLRNMYDCLDGDIDDDFVSPFTASKDTIHPCSYKVIIKLCEYLTDNNITPDNWKNYMSITSKNDNDSLGIFINQIICELTLNIKEERNLYHDLLNIINYLEIDNNQPHHSGCYVIEILCAQYAKYMIDN
mgnify:CR=1 FL=1